MSTAKSIDEQVKLFTKLEDRFKDKITPDTLDRRLTQVTDDKIARIEARIETLQAQKLAAVNRFDTAIEIEQKALIEVKSRRVDPKRDQDGRKPTRPKRTRTSKVAKGSKSGS